MAGIETYYVCEGWQLGLHTAVIHRGDCSQCNEGQGSGNEISAAGCRWYGPFSNANVAMDRSAALRDVAVLLRAFRAGSGGLLSTLGKAIGRRSAS